MCGRGNVVLRYDSLIAMSSVTVLVLNASLNSDWNWNIFRCIQYEITT